MRRALIVVVFWAALSIEGAAQIAVFDPAVTARNTVTAAVKEFLLNTERQQHSQLRRMAQRLSLFTDLSSPCQIRRAGAPTIGGIPTMSRSRTRTSRR